ncbi:MAG: HIT family protein [Anaeroplasmataceae bacterium]|nr:HIT family protein [Anaeroplasmataceae bacterium]
MSCLVCERIEWIKKGENPYFVCELETGYVVLGDFQRFKGYTIFLCKEHVQELHELPRDFKMKYLEEMSLVAEAVFKAYQPDKLNYELLGNGDSHMHFHIFPRRAGDLGKYGNKGRGPVWWLPREEMYHEKYKLGAMELNQEVKRVRNEILQLISKKEGTQE